MKLSAINKGLWAAVAIAILGFASIQFSVRYLPRQDDPAFRAEFELTNHHGKVQTEGDFAGRWMLVFFGFANCPDVCPTTLAEVAAVMTGLGEESAQFQPIFISIDPERDTPDVLAEFVRPFDADIIGLTGSPDQIAQTAETFPIYFERIEEATAPDGYTMGHTSHLFLFGPEAGFMQSWPYGTPAEEILTDLRQRI
ncbi:MAG: SCO family protein [Paracoccaceae bacterium]|uniref:SCO family protein n=1 Tax=Celeribacter marinus TaxID=1397108 RepID=UPI003174CEE8